MDTTTLKCKQCGAPQQLCYVDNAPVLKCTRCGTTERINETDAVTIERINAGAYKEVELGKKAIEKETVTAVQQLELEKKNQAWKRAKAIFILIVVIAAGVFGYFIYLNHSHKDDVRMPLGASSYCNRDYKDTVDLLTDAGFLNIEEVPVADLSKSDAGQTGIVTQVSINGNTTFTEKTWFPNSARVRVTYHILDPAKENQLQIPLSSDSCIGNNYSNVIDEFTNAGFTVEADEYADLTRDREHEDGDVTEITVGNRPEFKSGDWVSDDVIVSVEYHVLDPDRATDISVPGDSDQYIEKDYLMVCNEFETAGFTNILLTPLYDRTILDRSDPGLVELVLLNDTSIFYEGKWVPYDSVVEISYHADKLKYTGEQYLDIEAAIQAMGFNNVTSVPLDDLDPGELKQVGSVTSVLVDGIELFEVESFTREAEVIIKYHSAKTLTETRVAVASSSNDFSGEDYQTVVQALSDMGFTDITAVGLEDMNKVTGLVMTEGAVKSVSIDGRTKFDEGTVFESDVEVIVSYHSSKE